MAKLTSKQIELIREFGDKFGCYYVHNEREVSFEEAIDVFNGEQPKQKSIEQRRNDFGDTLRPYLMQYGKDMLNKFYKYWSEKDGVKMKFEHQTSWDLPKRLETWRKNDLEWERQRYIKSISERL